MFFKTGDTYNWRSIWIAFACYAGTVAVLFAIFFRHRHDPKAISPAVTP
jgi:NHS family xanthosine MFS transporter